jgi:hypothetical protein
MNEQEELELELVDDHGIAKRKDTRYRDLFVQYLVDRGLFRAAEDYLIWFWGRRDALDAGEVSWPSVCHTCGQEVDSDCMLTRCKSVACASQAPYNDTIRVCSCSGDPDLTRVYCSK